MAIRINVKYLMYIFERKHLAQKTVSKSVQVMYDRVHTSDVYTKFVFYILFNDINSDLQPPQQLSAILKYTKVVNYIRDNIFARHTTIKTQPQCLEVSQTKAYSMAQDNIYDIMKFLLVIERNIEGLHLSDETFFADILSQMSNKTKKEILNLHYKISPILILILETIDMIPIRKDDESSGYKDIPEYYKEFFVFLKSTKMDFRTGFVTVDKHKLDYKKLEKQLLNSRYEDINKFHSYFVNFYPELIFSTNVCKNRMYRFENPLNLSLNYKTLSSEILTNLYFMKLMNPKLDDMQFDVLYKLIYIERILQNTLTKKMCRLLHQLIIENQVIVYVLLRRKFNIEHAKMMVKYIPSFHLAFDASFKLFADTKDKFYLTIIQVLISKYKVKDYIKCIKDNASLFPDKFVRRYERFFDEL